MRSDGGVTALMFAAKYGHKAAMPALIGSGAGVIAASKGDEWTVLMLAAKEGHEAFYGAASASRIRNRLGGGQRMHCPYPCRAGAPRGHAGGTFASGSKRSQNDKMTVVPRC